MRTAEKAGAEHGVGVARQDGAQQRRNLHRIVFEVGILHDDHVARGGLDRGADRRALAAVDRVAPHLVDASLGVQPVEDLAAAIARGVVDADDLLVDRHGANLLDQRFEGAGFVVHRNQDRDAQGHRERLR